MKILFPCLVFSTVSVVSAQNVEEESQAPSDVPTVSPTVPPPPTAFPTLEGPYEYLPWGETNFGDKKQDYYYWGHQHAIRRPGWSWGEPLAGYAPFCYGNKTADNACFSVASACNALKGTLLHDYYCSFPEDVKIAGPSCWKGECVADGREVCAEMGGITIGNADVEWCLLKGDYTVFGPACYNDNCYQDEMASVCSSLDGKVWNRNYCLLKEHYTVVGPVCWRAACFSGTENECKAIDGVPIAKWWCLKKGCDYTVIGPTCSMVPENIQEQCFEDDTISTCRAVGGDLFAQRFCVVPGTDWTMFGPNAFYDVELINDMSRFCRELQDNIPPFNNIVAYDIGKRFCLINRRMPPVGPYCKGNTCYGDNVTAMCEYNGGENAGPIMCALSWEYQRAEGPLMWNGETLETSHPNCSGFFCAIPQPNVGENLRCPTSAPLFGSPTYDPNQKPPTPGGGPTPSAAVSQSQLAVLIGLVGPVIALW